MKIRIKLFLTIGSIFLIIALLSYYLPKLLLRHDIDIIRETFNKLILAHQEDDQLERKDDFLNRVQELVYTLNADLFFVYDSPFYNTRLNLGYPNSEREIWRNAIRYISYNPEIGFLQMSSREHESKSIVIDNAQVFQAIAEPLTDNTARIELIDTTSQSTVKKKNRSYFGVKITDRSKVPVNFSDQLLLGKLAGILHPSYYLLYQFDTLFHLPIRIKSPRSFWARPNHLKNQFHSVYALHGRQIQTNMKHLNVPPLNFLDFRQLDLIILKSGSLGAQSFAVNPSVAFSLSNMTLRLQAREVQQVIRRHLVHTLLNNLKQDSPLDPHAPMGIVEILPTKEQSYHGKGFALLSREVFFESPLFDAKKFYDSQRKTETSVPIPPQPGLIDNLSLDEVFVANTLKLNGNNSENFLTIGTSLKPILEDLAISNELVVFLTDALGVRLAFDGTGKHIPSEYFKNFPTQEMIASNHRTVTVDGISYDYFKIQPLADIPTYVLIIIPQTQEILYKFKNTMSSEMLQVTGTISYQLLAVNLLCLGIGLVILGFISGRITKPIALLAKATQEVANGHYSDVKMPIDPNRKDELATLTRSFSDMISGLRDRERIRGVLNKVVSKEIAEEILSGRVHLGGEEKIVTIFFSDIRHFSKMTEHLPPQDVIFFLNTYMTKMSNIIENEGGVIDKYVGDEIMALYGAPMTYHDDALRAIRTALIMLKTLREWNRERAKNKLPPVEIGIGIHTGNVVAGNMGAENRLNYTVLGANVNLASRLCIAASPMQILITEHTLNAYNVRNSIEVVELPPMKFKGFSEAIRTYSVIRLLQDDQHTEKEV